MNMVEGTLARANDALSIEFAGNRLTIDPELVRASPALAAYDGRRLTLGVRPEDMEDGGPRARLPDRSPLQDHRGAQGGHGVGGLIHLSLDAPPVLTEDTKELAADRGEDVEELEQLVTRAPWIGAIRRWSSQAAESDAIETLVDTKRLHFFDADTGEAIRGEA